MWSLLTDVTGAIPPMAEMQAQFFLLLSQTRIPKPTTTETYHLLHSPGGRIQYGVDYSTYMATLARDMGSSPGLRQLWKEYGWFITFIYWYVTPNPTAADGVCLASERPSLHFIDWLDLTDRIKYLG
jgi:hypothetical protein